MEEWQKPYLDIPVDDYLTSEDFLLSQGYQLNHVPRLNELIGPHEGRYMNLMRHYIKPICLLDRSHLSYWEDEISSRNYGVIPASEHEVIVHLPTEKERALRLISLYKIPGAERADNYHIQFGYLLGYDTTCIEAFCIRFHYILSANTKLANSTIFKSVEKFKQAKLEGIIPDLSTMIEDIIHDTEKEISGGR
jgi:hypothetical protein